MKMGQLNIESVAGKAWAEDPAPQQRPIHCLCGHFHFPLSNILCGLIGKHFFNLAGKMQILFVVTMVTTCFDYSAKLCSLLRQHIT